MNYLFQKFKYLEGKRSWMRILCEPPSMLCGLIDIYFKAFRV